MAKLIQLDEFVAINTNKFVEVAGSSNAKNQCVDLVNAYLRDVLGAPIVEWADAITFKDRLQNTYTWIENGDNNYPPPGSIVIWGAPYGPYTVNGKKKYAGHIAVAVKGSTKDKLVTFDQNFPELSPCKIVNHTYTGVLGWFEIKGGTMAQVSDSDFLNMRMKSDNRDELFTALGVALTPIEPKADKAVQSINGLKNVATGLSRQLSESQAEVKNREEQVKRIQQTYEASAKTQDERIKALEMGQKSFDSERQSLKGQIDEFAIAKGQLNIENERLKTQLAQEQAKSCSTMTIGDVVMLLWNKIQFIKLK